MLVKMMHRCSGIDTRVLTKKIRENGTLLGKVLHLSFQSINQSIVDLYSA